MKTLLAFILSLPLLAFAGGHGDHDQPTMGSTAGERPDGAPAMEHPAGHDEPTMGSDQEHGGAPAEHGGEPAGARPDGAPVMDD